jgi:hypothetical protein
MFNFFFFKKILPFVIWKTMVEPYRLHDNIIRRMRFACWITKATDSHTEDVILIDFPRPKWLRGRALVLG